MNKQGQITIIFLWVLIVLTILAVGVGHRVALALRLSRYQKDKLTALCLAKAGINKAIGELQKDKNEYDALTENWAGDEDAFKEIKLDDNSPSFATISYIDEDDPQKIQYGLRDEEGKININTASEELLFSFLERAGLNDPVKIANNIRVWRGDPGITVPDYQGFGYTNKANMFSNREELLLVKDIDNEIFGTIKNYIAVSGSGKININTASSLILEALIESGAKKLEKEGITESDPQDLAQRILQLRENGAVFESLGDLKAKLEAQKELSSVQKIILTKIETEADTKSTCFYIISDGKVNKRDTGTKTECIFNRNTDKIIYWHES